MNTPDYSTFLDAFERTHGERPREPRHANEDPEDWASIANWEYMRAEALFACYALGRDLDAAIRGV